MCIKLGLVLLILVKFQESLKFLEVDFCDFDLISARVVLVGVSLCTCCVGLESDELYLKCSQA